MPIGFSRIRIAGFKSFAEPCVVEVHPGLTGIVGPNGCGKSNIVEALRWAMGESSAKSLRGGEMDDVIFAGTTHRPARNLAEVTLLLEAGAGRPFPAPFDLQSELEVARRIERGSGSSFRVNGKEARARDVQTLFADLASGARSSAMVSQGRVGALVSARPDERRSILEEAAGISGLHSRRHEAELKLRAAEANMERAEDGLVQLTAQLAGLQKQAKQAARYRNLSGLIRAAETELLAVQRARSEAARAAANQKLAELRAQIAELAAQAEAQAASAVGASDALPGLRATEGEARTALERCRIAREQVEAEQAAARAALAAARDALQRLGRDQQHAAQLRADAEAAEQRLGAEAARLAQEIETLPGESAAAEAALAAAEAVLRDADALMHATTTEAAALEARGQACTNTLAGAEARLRKLAAGWEALRRDRAALQLVEPERLERLGAEVAAGEASAVAAVGRLEAAEAAKAAAEGVHREARARLHEAEPVRARLMGEQQALVEVLEAHGPGANGVGPRGVGAHSLVDALAVPEGLEEAIGAVLGEELELAIELDAPRHLRVLEPLDPCPALPEGVTPLAGLIEAPSALARALSQIGLVDAAVAEELQACLLAGQVLVSRAGGVWRWDGFVQMAGAPTAAAVRLRQRNRLADLRAMCAKAAAAHEVARATIEAASGAERAAVAAEAEARSARRGAEQGVERQRQELHSLQRRAASDAARIAALDEQISRLAGEREAAETERDAARQAQAALPELVEAREAVDQARRNLAGARAVENEARGRRDGLQRQAGARQARQRAILGERAGWTDRARDAAARLAELDGRLTEAAANEAALAGRPDRLAEARQASIQALAEAEQGHAGAARRLKEAEGEAAAAVRADRAAENALVAAREAVLRAESDAREADHAWGAVAERVLEKLGAHPHLPAPADVSSEAEERARRRAERLAREREEMGPVNLRAELEAGEIEARTAVIDKDREELSTAINKLRGSIGHLNREGRERLTTVFSEVDKHFQQLFGRMFGGGRAHLALVGSDDPLQAGLEIYVQPPGKKLATLSLLSGGEQALTALSLIFAIFKCNPAPVCVLDEVDAPLDDANIDRFCALLQDMVEQTGTRFLVVTHHHMTMARMDRLYGVTMQERGVSRLLSVDLQRATEMTVAMAAE